MRSSRPGSRAPSLSRWALAAPAPAPPRRPPWRQPAGRDWERGRGKQTIHYRTLMEEGKWLTSVKLVLSPGSLEQQYRNCDDIGDETETHHTWQGGDVVLITHLWREGVIFSPELRHFTSSLHQNQTLTELSNSPGSGGSCEWVKAATGCSRENVARVARLVMRWDGVSGTHYTFLHQPHGAHKLGAEIILGGSWATND